MRFELSQRFFFDAAHTLNRTVETESSRRIHGHTYIAELVVTAALQPESCMVVDLAVLRAAITPVRERLDHHLLNEVPGLVSPTLEGLCLFIAQGCQSPNWTVKRVSVGRDASGDRCSLMLG
ncbi:MAG: 6-pyruvoyl trahydropterin synthase family protein [Inhella sp.]